MSATAAKIDWTIARLNSMPAYRGRYMHAGFKALGASMKERSGTVESWVRSMLPGNLDSLIEQLGGDPEEIAREAAYAAYGDMHDA